MTAHINTLAGMIKVDGDIYTVPCLAGRDVDRGVGEVLIARNGDVLADARGGEELVIVGDTTLQGWGKLNGEAAVCAFVDRSGETYGEVAIPVSLLDELRDRTGLALYRRMTA